jgi:hypothetical protein
MKPSPRVSAKSFVWSATLIFCTILGQAQDAPSVRRMQVMASRNPVEIEIESSNRIVPQTQVLTGPDRLVVDFAGVVPSAQLRNQTVNLKEVKSLRVGLFASNPPVTRVVFDLNGPQPYQVFPSGRTVIIKVGGTAAQAASFNPSAPSGPRLVTTNYPIHVEQIATPVPPPLTVSFAGGMLTVKSNKASLSEVLFAVHQRTGADIAIPPGAEQETVVAEIGPASAPEVLSTLLNGSKFNFLILSSASDPNVLDRVILSARPEGPAPAYTPLQPMRTQAEDEVEPAAPARTPPVPAETPTQPDPSTKPQNNDIPD